MADEPKNDPKPSEKARELVDVLDDVDARLKEHFDTLKSHLGPLISTARAYIAVVTIAGYIGTFTIWGYMKNDLNDILETIIALLLTISILGFVGFHVVISYIAAQNMHSIAKSIKPREIKEKIEESERKSNIKDTDFSGIYAISFWISLPTGLLAGLILAGAFVHKLVSDLICLLS